MRPEILFPLFQSIKNIKGIGPKTLTWVKKLCGRELILDLLFHLPTSLKHRHRTDDFENHQNEWITFQGKVIGYEDPKFSHRPFKIFLESNTQEIELIYFNTRFVSSLKQKFQEGDFVWVSGLLQKKENSFFITHPDYLTQDPNKIFEFEPIYPMIQNIPSLSFSKIVRPIAEKLSPLPEWLSFQILKDKNWPAWHESLKGMHAPQANEEDLLDRARQRLIFDELLANQIALKLIRLFHQKQWGIACPCSHKIDLKLPFQLTHGQEKVLTEIYLDLESNFPMNRFLQGDVGSGKTIVALLAALQVIKSGFQVVLLAPTDILARQHYQKIKSLLTPLSLPVALLTAKEKGKHRTQILNSLKTGEILFLIGTHAVIEENVQFKNLGFCIVDEQHRFGVNQRLNLIKKQKGVNLLVMSATPIPRSLFMTACGDMEISILDEKPEGRKPIQTYLINFSQLNDMIKKLKHTDAQIYWVCPLIEENEKSDLAAVQKRFQILQGTFGDKVGLLHGKMKPDEKAQVVQDFQSGKIKILVSTTVVEVGVDVPSASVMIVEQAERFGLATLHQLRGRVGRGQEKAFCFLLHGKLTDKARERLTLLRNTEDGFKIAQADLKMRGAGEVLGTRQSGFEAFRLAHLPENQDLLDLANEYAQKILSKDPELKNKENENVHILLYLFEKEKAIMTLKAG